MNFWGFLVDMIDDKTLMDNRLAFFKPELVRPNASWLSRRVHYQHGKSAPRGEVGPFFPICTFIIWSLVICNSSKAHRWYFKLAHFLILEYWISKCSQLVANCILDFQKLFVQDAGILQCQWRGWTDDQKTVQVNQTFKN